MLRDTQKACIYTYPGPVPVLTLMLGEKTLGWVSGAWDRVWELKAHPEGLHTYLPRPNPHTER